MGFKKIILWLIAIFLSIFYFLIDESNEDKVSQLNLSSENTPTYKDRIENFSSQVFNDKNQTTHLIEASAYESYQNQPDLLIQPKISFFKESSEELDYVLTADQGRSLDNGDYLLTGSISIQSNSGKKHIMQSNTMIYRKETQDMISEDTVTYFSDKDNLKANGMHMVPKKDKLTFTGNTEIKKETGARIISSDVIVDKEDNKNIFKSDQPSTFHSNDDEVSSEGFEYKENDAQITLLGNTKLIQPNGTLINSKNLIIDNSGENEVFKTGELIDYQSKVSKIYSKGMVYDPKSKKLNLFNGVEGEYK